MGTAGLSFFVGSEPVIATVMMQGVVIASVLCADPGQPLRALNQSAIVGARIFCALPPTNVPMCPPGTATSV